MKHECFDFKAKIFQVEGAYFFASQPAGDVYYRICLADGVDASLKLESIRREFAIPDESEDNALLAKVQAALRYVKKIAPGDKIPREIIDGTASWAIEDRHIDTAKRKLGAKMMEWLAAESGAKSVGGDVDDIFKSDKVKSGTQAAFSVAAEKLGFGPEHGDRVLALIERLANELAYIEALREFFGKVFRIQSCLPVVTHILSHDKMAVQEAGRVKELIRRPLARYSQTFNNVDAQTGEVLSALKNIVLVTEFIRKARDELHEQTLLWSEIVDDWAEDPSDSKKNEYRKLGKLYRFLAQHFLEDNA